MEIHIRIFPAESKRWSEIPLAKQSLRNILHDVEEHVCKAFITRTKYAAGAQGFLDDDGCVVALVEINRMEEKDVLS